MNFEQIEAFMALLDTGSFHGAAARLGVSQPTVSQRLQKLEFALSCALLERGREGCRPTAEAQALLPHARAMLQLRARAQQSVKRQRIAIGASSNIGCYVLAPLLRPWMGDESVGTDVSVCSNPEIFAKLENGLLDLGLTEWWDRRKGLSAVLWRSEELVLIISPEHPFAELTSVPAACLARESFLGGEAGTGTGTLLQRAFGRLASRFKVAQTLGSTEAVKAGVMAGWGISIVFRSAVEKELKSGTLLTRPVVGHTLEKKLYLVQREDVIAGSPVTKLIAFLKKADFSGA